MMLLSMLAWLLGGVFALAPPASPPKPPRVADAEAGRNVFRMCAPCHMNTPDGRNTLGPNLFGVVDKPAGRLAGYNYSNAMRMRAAAGLVWTDDDLRAYLTDPRAFLPGGSKAFAGLKDAGRMDDLLAYLRQQK